MGGERKFDGVRASSKSTIEIDFYYQGGRCRERIRLEPSPANLKRAAQHRAAILHAISTGTFDYLTTFPDSSKAKQFAARSGNGSRRHGHVFLVLVDVGDVHVDDDVGDCQGVVR